MRLQALSDRRAIIERRILAARIGELAKGDGPDARPAIVAALKDALEKGRVELARRLEARPPGRARRSRRAPHLRWCSGSAHGAG